MFKVNPVYTPALDAFKYDTHPIVFLDGGRVGGRSHFIRSIVHLLLMDKKPYKARISLLRFVKEDVRDSLWREIIDALEQTPDPKRPNKSMLDVCKSKGKFDNHRMRLEYNGHSIVADGFTTSQARVAKMKAKAKFTHAFIDEFIEVVDPKLFDDLNTTLRPFVDPVSNVLIKPQIFCAYNMPPKDHWVIQRYFNLVEDPLHAGYYRSALKEKYKSTVCRVFATYKDNIVWLNSLLEAGGQDFVKAECYRMLEHYKDSNNAQDQETYKVEVLGLIPSGKSGRIFTDWEPISYAKWKEIPVSPIFGVDFGYSHDPSTVSGVKYYNGDFYHHNFIYAHKLMGSMLASRIKKEIPEYYNYMFYCDAGDGGRAMDELKSYLGQDEVWDLDNFRAAAKGQESRLTGVTYLLGFKHYYTEESVLLAKELQDYHWVKNKNKTGQQQPSDGGDDILDGIRYAVVTHHHPSFRSAWDGFFD
jgi:phage terminase large subunit